MKKILIFGGTGFIGRSLLPLLSQHQVTLISRSRKNHLKWPQLQCDRDTDDISTVDFEDRYDMVIDISGMRKDWVVNAHSALKHRTDKYVYVSSASVYRDYDGLNTNESMPTGGGQIWGNYGKNKSDSEDFLRSQNDYSVCILRPTYMFGEHNHMDRETFVWSRIKNGNPIFMPKNSASKIQFSDVQLVADIIRSLVDDQWHDGVFNVSNQEAISFAAWVRMLAEVLGAAPKVKELEIDRPEESLDFFPFADHNVSVSTNKLEETFKLPPQLSLRDRFAQTYAFSNKYAPYRMRLKPGEKELYRRNQEEKLLSDSRKIRLYLEYLARCSQAKIHRLAR